MYVPPIQVILKDGRTATLRSAAPADAADLIQYMKSTAAETPFLLREPGEFDLTVEQEEAFLRSRADSNDAVMLVAFVDGVLAGSCSVMPVGSLRRLRHRCLLAIAVCQPFWSIGLGRELMNEALHWAGTCGYEQAELEVMEENTAAYALYDSLGFRPYGRQEHNMKYADGSYGAAVLMMRPL